MPRLNLLPWREQRREARRRRFRMLLGALLAGSLAVLLGTDRYLQAALERQAARNAFLQAEIALLDTQIGLILLYTLSVLPIVIWIMRDQFSSIPTDLEEAALVDGLSIWGAFLTIILPIALPGMVAAFILSLVLTWNEYFFAALLTSTHANTLPVMLASQTGSNGISWWSMAALAFASILPLIVIGVVLERYIIKGMAAGAVK